MPSLLATKILYLSHFQCSTSDTTTGLKENPSHLVYWTHLLKLMACHLGVPESKTKVNWECLSWKKHFCKQICWHNDTQIAPKSVSNQAMYVDQTHKL